MPPAPPSSDVPPPPDISGTLASIGQSLRSLDKRLQAVERRLSLESPGFQVPPGLASPEAEAPLAPGAGVRDLRAQVEEVQRRLYAVESLATPRLVESVMALQARLDTLSVRLEKRVADVERSSTGFHLGRLRVPLDLTGLVAAGAMGVVALFMATGSFDALKSPLFPLLFGGAFIGAVAAKLYLANKQGKDEGDIVLK